MLNLYLVMAEDQRGVRPILATEYPSALPVQEQGFQNTMDDDLFLTGVWTRDGGEQTTDDFPTSLKDTRHGPFGFWSAAPAMYDQSNITFPENLAFSHTDGSSIQAKSPKVDEIVASHKSAETLECAWPGCRLSFRRKTDLTRHVNSKHFPVRCYICTVAGCNRTFHRKDKLRDHERCWHHSEIATSQKDTSATATTQAANDAQDLQGGFLGLDTEDHTCDEMDPRPSFLRQFDEQVRLTWSSPATEGSCGQSEDSSRASDGLSRKDSISTRSTSSRRTVSSKNRSELRPATWVREIGRAGLRFACPFRKHDRHEYDIHRYRVCATSGWISVARVK